MVVMGPVRSTCLELACSLISALHRVVVNPCSLPVSLVAEAALDMLIYLNGNDRGSSLSLEIIAMRPAPLHVQV